MNITPAQRRQIESSLGKKYENVAAGASGQFRYPTGVEGLKGLGYQREWYGHLPEAVQASFCGVGNPFAMGRPARGWSVLDVGAGSGVDTLLAAGCVGPEGLALGLERSPAMVAKARENTRSATAPRAMFLGGNAEELPFTDARFDLVISNGAYNLVIDKDRALAEAYRVLKPGGRFQVADQILIGPAQVDAAEAVASWFT